MSPLEHFLFFFMMGGITVSMWQISHAVRCMWRVQAIEKGLIR